MSVVLYAALGVVIDLGICLYYRCISSGLLLPASALGSLITLISFIVFQKIIVKWNSKLVLAYAIGNGIGTAIGMMV